MDKDILHIRVLEWYDQDRPGIPTTCPEKEIICGR